MAAAERFRDQDRDVGDGNIVERNIFYAALCKSGAKPMLHGFIVSLLVVLVAIAVEYMLGIAPYGTLV